MRILSACALSGLLLVGARKTKLEAIYDALFESGHVQLNRSERDAHAARFMQHMNEKGGDPVDVFRKSMPAVPQAVVDSVARHPDLLWTPLSPEDGRYSQSTRGAAERECGSVLGSQVRKTLPFREVDAGQPIPDSFDSRTAFGDKCAKVIGTAQDQSGCGSCWAFSTTTSLEDRLCIQAHQAGMEYHGSLVLSALDTLSCCGRHQGCMSSAGCNGGDPAEAWRWFANQGVVTGGEFGDSATCKPYAFPHCAHHVKVDGMAPCDGEEYDTPKCEKKCSNPDYSENTYTQDKHKAVLAYAVPKEENRIKREIMANGPVSAAFTVYEDFLLYSSGIYHHVSGEEVGGHAVKMIGWGIENGVKYWLIVNSWNPTWGEGGLFRIKLDEGGIMDEITAGTPVLPAQFEKEPTIEIDFE